MQYRSIQKNGGSLQVGLPKAYLEYLEIGRGDYVSLELSGETILIKKTGGTKNNQIDQRVRKQRKYRRKP